MQQVTGRLTADATVKTFDSGKSVVNFSIAENQRYKPKGADSYTEVPTFFNCSYWISTGIAKVLRKGAIVTISGRITARPYQTNTGDLAASLNILANHIEFSSYAPRTGEEEPSAEEFENGTASTSSRTTGRSKKSSTSRKQSQAQPQENDDLPF